MKEFFSKIWAWVLKNKVVSIVIASVFVVGLTCAIVLPIALRHNHDFGTELQYNATHHYLECECGDKKDETAHIYDKEVAGTDYLHTEATATTNGVYYKSCVCGAKGTETFELEKTVATITNIQDLSTQYTSQQMTNPTFNTNSDGTATFAWYNSLNQLLPNAPTSAGTYTVKISIPETVNYQAVTEEREFVISKRVLTIPTSFEKVYSEYNTFEFTIDSAESGTGKEVWVEVNFVDLSAEPVAIKNAGSYDETEGTFTINQIKEAGVSTSNYELDLANADFEVDITKKAISNVVFSLGTNNTGTVTLTIMSFHAKGIIANDKLEFTVNIDSDTLTAGQEYSVTTNQADAGAGGPYYVEIEDTSVGLENYDIDWSTIKVKCTASS